MFQALPNECVHAITATGVTAMHEGEERAQIQDMSQRQKTSK